uniref:Uncharacterized protein n=1 Tax=Graphocephala atropunctata TaxID=36148 RepID=A0A1B6LN12_9HEMI
MCLTIVSRSVLIHGIDVPDIPVHSMYSNLLKNKVKLKFSQNYNVWFFTGLMEALAEECREDPRQLNIKFTSIFPFIVSTGLCKKPKIRFPTLLGIVSPQEAARQIIQAMRKDVIEMSIPSGLLTVNYVFRLFPVKVTRMVKDFLDSGLESHD